ncbi:hypothetical protein [Kaarinaea lacus]
MTKQTTNEQITLYSPEYGEQTETIDLNQVTLELLQTSKWKEQHKLFRIYDNKYLNVNEKHAKRTSSYNVHLTLLNPNPTRKRCLNAKYLLIAGILFGLAWLVYSLIQQGVTGFTNPYMYSLVVLPVTAGIILIVYMIKKFKHVLIFYSDHGRVPVVEMFYKNPSKNSFNAFAGELINCIQAVKAENYYNDSQTLAAELSEHRRLRDEGVFSDEVYEQAKANILTNHSSPNQREPNETVH